MADPLGHLALGGDDWTIASAVVTRARVLANEYRIEEFRALARLIGSEVARALGG